jgi:hypothetical protein
LSSSSLRVDYEEEEDNDNDVLEHNKKRKFVKKGKKKQ